jgi:hypothetical protein
MEGSHRTMKVDACVEEILDRGLDDWIQASEVASVAKLTGGEATTEGIESLALEVIGHLVRGELMAPGDVTTDGFSEWGMRPDEAVRRITTDWKALGRLPNLGEICWLSSTSTGARKARERAARELTPIVASNVGRTRP